MRDTILDQREMVYQCNASRARSWGLYYPQGGYALISNARARDASKVAKGILR